MTTVGTNGTHDSMCLGCRVPGVGKGRTFFRIRPRAARNSLTTSWDGGFERTSEYHSGSFPLRTALRPRGTAPQQAHSLHAWARSRERVAEDPQMRLGYVKLSCMKHKKKEDALMAWQWGPDSAAVRSTISLRGARKLKEAQRGLHMSFGRAQ